MQTSAWRTALWSAAKAELLYVEDSGALLYGWPMVELSNPPRICYLRRAVMWPELMILPPSTELLRIDGDEEKMTGAEMAFQKLGQNFDLMVKALINRRQKWQFWKESYFSGLLCQAQICDEREFGPILSVLVDPMGRAQCFIKLTLDGGGHMCVFVVTMCALQKCILGVKWRH